MNARILAVLAVLVVLAASVPAVASPPCYCLYPWSSPQDGSGSVPTNARLFLSWDALDEASLELVAVAEPGSALPFRLEAAGDDLDQTWLVPEAELLPDTEYRLTGVRDDNGGAYTLGFTTGAAPDEAAPTLGAVEIAGTSLGGACGGHLAAEVQADAATDDVTPSAQLVFRLEIVDPEAEPGTTVLFVPAGHPVLGLAVGDDAWDNCLDNFPGALPEHEYLATVAAFDWAGNASEASDQQTFALQTNLAFDGDNWFGCATGGTPSALLPLLGLLLLARRRRGA